MEWYRYDEATGEYISSVRCQRNPIKPEQFFPVENATPDQPLSAKKGFAVVFNNGTWRYIEDHRNKTVYNKIDHSELEIKDLGAIPDTYTEQKPNEFDVWMGNGWKPDTDRIAKVIRERCAQQIDRTAGAARKRIVTDSSLVEVEYTRTYNLAVQFIDNHYTGEVPGPVKSHSEAYGVSNQEAADAIKLIGDNWFATLDLIRDIRLKGKKAVEKADDNSDFEAIAQPFINQLNSILPELSA